MACESGGGVVAERSLFPRANLTPTVSPTSLDKPFHTFNDLDCSSVDVTHVSLLRIMTDDV